MREPDVGAIDRALAVLVSCVAVPKRDRASLLLARVLAVRPGKRRGSWHHWVQDVARWLDPSKVELLEADAFASHFGARFGVARGIFVGPDGPRAVAISEAFVLGTDWSVFVGDAHDLCLVFGEVGPPMLCRP